MKQLILSIACVCLIFFMAGCSPSASQLKKTIEENPDILFSVIEKHPKAFLQAANKAANSARHQIEEERKKKDEKSLEDDFDNPKNADISGTRAIFGEKDAPITIVEYSDFQCVYCAKAASTIEKIKNEYSDKVRVLYKHLPFRPMAEPAARYYEAIAKQSTSKAKDFHDVLYDNQKKISEGEAYLKEVAKKVGADLSKIKNTKDTDEITEIIKADTAEARKLGFSGTPCFLVNGVRVHGAYPLEHFKMIIDRHLKKKS